MKKLSLLFALFCSSLAWAQNTTQCLVQGVWVPCSMAPQPSFVQAPVSSKSTGSVASINATLGSNTQKFNTLIVVFANGNNNNPAAPVTDTLTLTWFKAVQVANSTTHEAEIWYAPNTVGGADTVTVTPGGTNASIAMTVYEVPGLVYPALNSSPAGPQAIDQSTSNTGTGATSPSVTVTPILPNTYVFAAFALGTAAQTITIASPYNNDSGQQNPTTPSGLFSFVSASLFKTEMATSSPSATATSEPWAVAVASFKTLSVPVQGVMQGMGTAGSPSGLILSVQGAAGETPIVNNVTQFGGTNISTGTGASGAGIPRVTIANDSSLAANQSVNLNQIAGAAPGNTNPLSTAISDGTNGPVAVKAASTSAVATDKAVVVQLSPNSPALTTPLNVNQTQIAGTTLIADPCQTNTRTTVNINLAASGQIITGTSAKKTYICSLDIVSATAQNIALVEGTGSTCATGIAGMAGGTTAATGWNFGANGGLVKGTGSNWIYQASNANADNVCLLLSSTGQTSGSAQYVQQ